MRQLKNNFKSQISLQSNSGQNNDDTTVVTIADEDLQFENGNNTTSPKSSGGSTDSARLTSWWKQKANSITRSVNNNINSQVQTLKKISEESRLNRKGGSNEQQEGSREEDQQQPNDTQTEEKKGDGLDPLRSRTMNPAMAKLLEEKEQDKKEEKSFLGKAGDSFMEKAGDLFNLPKEDGEDDEDKPPKCDLPQADPPKLVLARTRWLLQHGEAVMPPYHAFSSNSECIAVFCKTGYWSNLQSDVFLHSTAICNIKSSGLATMGVAASVPLLAPVVGLAGIGMVAAPWLVLRNAKAQTEQTTQKLTDLFWEQAGHEVFVECITHWSKIEEYYAKKIEQEAAAVAAAIAAEEELVAAAARKELGESEQSSSDSSENGAKDQETDVIGEDTIKTPAPPSTKQPPAQKVKPKIMSV